VIKGIRKIIIAAVFGVIALIILGLLGVFFLCAICAINSNPFPACENDFPPVPTNNTTRYPFSPDSFLRTHTPAEHIALSGTFRDWSDTSYHNVKLMGSTGDVRGWSWGDVAPEIQFVGYRDNLDIDWDTTYLSDDSWGGGVPAYDYMYLPYNASCDIDIRNDIGSVIVQDLNGPSLMVDTNKGMLRIENCSFAEIHCSATTSITAGFRSENASFRSASGDITLRVPELKGDIHARTDKGNINLFVPAGAGFVLDAGTNSGKITCDIPLDRSVDKSSHIAGTTKQSSDRLYTIDLETLRGNIRIIVEG